MTAQRQADLEDDSELAFGYCMRCHGYGRGEYVGPINSHSDAIRDHRKCPASAAPRGGQSRRGRQP